MPWFKKKKKRGVGTRASVSSTPRLTMGTKQEVVRLMNTTEGTVHQVCTINFRIDLAEITIWEGPRLLHHVDPHTLCHVIKADSGSLDIFVAEPDHFPGTRLMIGIDPAATGASVEQWAARLKWCSRNPGEQPGERLGHLWMTTIHLMKTWASCDSSDEHVQRSGSHVDVVGIGQDEIAQFCERLGFPQDPEAALRLSHAVFKAMGQGPELLAPLPSVDEAVAMGIEDDIPETEQLLSLEGVWIIRQMLLEVYCQLLNDTLDIDAPGFCKPCDSTTNRVAFSTQVSHHQAAFKEQLLGAELSLEEALSAMGGIGRVDGADRASLAEFARRFKVDPAVFEVLQVTESKGKRPSVPAGIVIDALHSPANSVTAPLSTDGDYYDTAPINEYFINSSHNTYLVGPQVYGTSSIDAYSRVLLEGARCVEIDVWDGPNGEPIITHGHAYCSSILLADVIEAIGEFAFVASDLPVIISLENHTHAPQQVRMASVLRAKLGDKLLHEPLPDFDLETCPVLPPPGKLRNKILLKWKNPKLGDDDDDSETLGHTVYIGVLEVAAPNVIGLGTPGDETFDRCCCLHTDTITLLNTSVQGGGSTGDQDVASADAVLREMEADLRDDYDDLVAGTSDKVDVFSNRDMTAEVVPIQEGEDPLSEIWKNCFTVSMKGEVRFVARAPADAVDAWIAHLNATAGGGAAASADGADLKVSKSRTHTGGDEATAVKAKLAKDGKDIEFMSELTSLVNYFTAVKHHHGPYAPHQMSSVKEAGFKKWLRNDTTGACNFMFKNMLRLYPAGTRIGSSNYDPGFCWNFGVQMVALNMQTTSAPMWLNECMFAQTGQSGYVRKPAILKDPALYPLASLDNLSSNIISMLPTDVFIRVLSGRLLPLGFKEKPYKTSVSVTLVSTHCVDIVPDKWSTHRSSIADPNCLCPTYNLCGGFSVFLPELAFFKITLTKHMFNKKDKVIGLRYVSVSGLKPGFRSVWLHDEDNRRLPTSMLLQVDVLDKAIHRSVATRDAAGSDAGSDALGSGVSIAVTRHSAVPTAELPRSASDASVIDHFRLLFESAEFNELGEEKATSEDLRVSRRAGKRRPKFVGLDTKKVDVSKVTSKVGAYIGTGTHAKKREGKKISTFKTPDYSKARSKLASAEAHTSSKTRSVSSTSKSKLRSVSPGRHPATTSTAATADSLPPPPPPVRAHRPGSRSESRSPSPACADRAQSPSPALQPSSSSRVHHQSRPHVTQGMRSPSAAGKGKGKGKGTSTGAPVVSHIVPRAVPRLNHAKNKPAGRKSPRVLPLTSTGEVPQTFRVDGRDHGHGIGISSSKSTTVGILINKVAAGSPFGTAGVKPGYRFITINGQPATTHDRVVELLEAVAGSSFKVEMGVPAADVAEAAAEGSSA